MGYAHINNLYKDTTILMFKEVWAMEKIHGTSAHVGWNPGNGLHFFSGGEKHENFVKLFDADRLHDMMMEKFPLTKVTVYGEAYGGKQQGMRATYGDQLRFIAFDVKVGDLWLSIPDAHALSESLGFEFVFYVKTPTDVDALNAERDRPSVQAIRNGMGGDKISEGVVLRPLIEVRMNNGERIVAKYKRDEFRETRTPRVIDPEKLRVLEDAKAIADEWVTPMRLEHVLQKLPGAGLEQARDVITAMIEDVEREGSGEIVASKEARKAIGSKAMALLKQRIKEQAGL